MAKLEDRARARIRSIHTSQKRRAKKHGCELPYTADELIDHLLPLGNCPYCGAKLTPKGFQVDHEVPIAAGGTFDLSNTQAICTSDNRRKHSLMPDRYKALLAFLNMQDEHTKRNVLARLAAGGAWLAGKY